MDPTPTLVAAGDGIALLSAALAKAQAKFAPIERSRTVTVTMASGGKYTFNYASLDTIFLAVRPALAENGLAITQLIVHDELITLLLHAGGGRLEARSPLPKVGRPQELGSAITYARRYAVQAILGVAAEEDDDGNAASGNERAIKERKSEPPALSEPVADKKPKPSLTSAPVAPATPRKAADGPVDKAMPRSFDPISPRAAAAGLPSHVKRFHARRKELDIDEESGKKILAEFGLTSSKDIPVEQIDRIVRRMEVYAGAEPPPHGWEPGDKPRSPRMQLIERIEELCNVVKIPAATREAVISRLNSRRVERLSDMTLKEVEDVWSLLDRAAKNDEASLVRIAEAASNAVPF